MMSISWNSLPVEMTYRMLDQLTGKPFFLSIANVGQTLEQNTVKIKIIHLLLRNIIFFLYRHLIKKSNMKV